MPENPEGRGVDIADSIRRQIEGGSFHFESAPVPVTASFGVTAFGESDTIESAFKRADHALYRPKNSGCNRCTVLHLKS